MARSPLRRLRWLRAALALVVFVPAALAFLDAGRLLPAWAAPLVAGAQLVPAVLRLPALGAAVAVAAILVATLVGGRVYCSTLCPLGTFQDLLVRLGDRLHRRGRYRFRHLPPRLGLHLAVAGAAAAAAALGAVAALELVEPWSAFGRMLAALLRPPIVGAVNALGRLLAVRHVYALEPLPAPAGSGGAVVVALATLAVLVALSLRRGRRFCNLLCPAGAALRLASRRPALRISLDDARCDVCGVCEKACKAGCIDAAHRRVDTDACVACFVCLDACPKGGVRYGRARASDALAAPAADGQGGTCAGVDEGRRALLQAAALAPAAALLAPAAARGALPGGDDPRDRRAPVTPPGSGDRRHFTAHCTACQLCVAACPTQVLRPSLLAYGPAGLLQPRLVYDAASCVFDCDRCGEVCPTGAIRPLPLAEKQRVQLGRARFVKADCVVETKKKACGACAEHCPTKAITMVPYPGGEPGLRIPEVNEDACIGCGACEHPCPVQPRKAIWVEARSPHGVARPLQRGKIEAPAAEEFPF
jgi:ferredoxin-type protein NapF